MSTAEVSRRCLQLEAFIPWFSTITLVLTSGEDEIRTGSVSWVEARDAVPLDARGARQRWHDHELQDGIGERVLVVRHVVLCRLVLKHDEGDFAPDTMHTFKQPPLLAEHKTSQESWTFPYPALLQSRLPLSSGDLYVRLTRNVAHHERQVLQRRAGLHRLQDSRDVTQRQSRLGKNASLD